MVWKHNISTLCTISITNMRNCVVGAIPMKMNSNYFSKNDITSRPHFCFLFDLILYVSSTIFQLYRDGSSWVEPVLS